MSQIVTFFSKKINESISNLFIKKFNLIMYNDFISEHKDELGSKASDNQKTIHDLVVLIENLKAIAQLFTVFGRHLNLCLAFLTQRLFKNNEFFRQISQNSDYMCVFKNPRNSREISTLASQITPKTLELLSIYEKATRDPYSYVLINLTQEGVPQLKYVSNVFSKNHAVNVYVSSSCK